MNLRGASLLGAATLGTYSSLTRTLDAGSHPRHPKWLKRPQGVLRRGLGGIGLFEGAVKTAMTENFTLFLATLAPGQRPRSVAIKN